MLMGSVSFRKFLDIDYWSATGGPTEGNIEKDEDI